MLTSSLVAFLFVTPYKSFISWKSQDILNGIKWAIFKLSFSETNADAANAEFKSNYDDGSRFVNSVMDKPIAFILMLGAWRAGLKGLSAMSKGGKFRIQNP